VIEQKWSSKSEWEKVIEMDSQLDRKKLEGMSFEIEELEQMLAELLESTFEMTPNDFNNPLKLSFVLRLTQDGIPKIESVGKSSFLKPKIPGAIEPISRIEENEGSYIITLDLLGHQKEDIEAVLDQNSLVVLSRNNRPFYKKFFLGKSIDQSTVTKIFKNNVLEIVLKKQGEFK